MTATSPSEAMDEINLHESSTVDDDVVVDEEFLDTNSNPNRSPNPFSEDYIPNEKTSPSDTDFFRFESTDNEDLFADRPMPEWVGWGEPVVGGSGVNPFEDYNNTPNGSVVPSGSPQKDSSGSAPTLFEEDVEFVGVELDGSEKAMDKALKEGIVGEAGALKRKVTVTPSEGVKDNDNDNEAKEFNDSNYWRVDQEIAVSE